MKTAMIEKNTKPAGRQLTCKRCQHKWFTRLEGRDPLNCPKCLNWYWNVDEPHLPESHRQK
jgi:hypothetical protein